MGNEHSREVLDGIPVSNSDKIQPISPVGSDITEGRDSPRPSISSEPDLPYIPYTVNRPIGDSPKHRSKGIRSLKSSGSSRKVMKKGRPQEIVVVRDVTVSTADPELTKIQRIPQFLPIMRSTLTAPTTRDPEVLERLDCSALRGLSRRYQIHLYAAASLVATHQDKVNIKIKETDGQVNSLVISMKERQREFARHADHLSQVGEVGHLVSRCHASLNLILETMESLNEILPINQRLEPFVWTTG